jgi:hypothetical protein
MKAHIRSGSTLYTPLLGLLCIIVLSGCSTVVDFVARDPRCQPRQYCIYTDPPPAIRTTVLRNQNTSGMMGSTSK